MKSARFGLGENNPIDAKNILENALRTIKKLSPKELKNVKKWFGEESFNSSKDLTMIFHPDQRETK